MAVEYRCLRRFVRSRCRGRTLRCGQPRRGWYICSPVPSGLQIVDGVFQQPGPPGAAPREPLAQLVPAWQPADTSARAIRSTSPHRALPILLLCDMAAAFPSDSRRWLRTVMEFAGVLQAALRVIDVVRDGMPLLLNVGGVVTIGLVLLGITPQGRHIRAVCIDLQRASRWHRLWAFLRRRTVLCCGGSARTPGLTPAGYRRLLANAGGAAQK